MKVTQQPFALRFSTLTLAVTIALLSHPFCSHGQVLTGDGLLEDSTVDTGRARTSVPDLEIDRGEEEPFSTQRDELRRFVGGNEDVPPLDLKKPETSVDSSSVENAENSVQDAEIDGGEIFTGAERSSGSSGSPMALFFIVGALLVGILGLVIWLSENSKRFTYARGGSPRSHRRRNHRGDSPY